MAVGTAAQDPVPPGGIHTQSSLDPVPSGEIKLSISGRCQSVEGDLLPNTKIELVGTESELRKVTQCDDAGEFRVSGLVPDLYRVTVSLAGYTTKVLEISPSSGSSGSIVLVLGPVPPGEFESSPVSENDMETSNSKVERVSLTDDLDLKAWLSRESHAGWTLRAIVSLGSAESLFAFDRGRNSDCLIEHEIWPIRGKRLHSRLELNPGHRLVGVHLLGSNTAALVLCRE